MKLNLTRNQKNVIKFSVCAAAVIAGLWLTTVDKWNVFHWVTLVAVIGACVWYLIHIFTDK